jgi:hypothetical protein
MLVLSIKSKNFFRNIPNSQLNLVSEIWQLYLQYEASYSEHTVTYLTARMSLKMFHMLNGHLDYLSLFYSPTSFLEGVCWDKTGQVSQAVIHAVSSPLFNDTV